MKDVAVSPKPEKWLGRLHVIDIGTLVAAGFGRAGMIIEQYLIQSPHARISNFSGEPFSMREKCWPVLQVSCTFTSAKASK